MTFKDHFSNHAAVYAKARPDYPAELFEYLASLCDCKDIAWDVACGSGQASLGLVSYFDAVIASDASIGQLSNGPARTGVQYLQGRSEDRFLSANSVDLICIAQAVHWFDMNRFFQIARTVLKRRGVIAAWCYGLTRISEDIDEIVDYLYEPVLGAYWPAERRIVEDAYRHLYFPFDEIAAPGFVMEKFWSLEELLVYLESWSALQRFIKTNEKNPLADLKDDFRNAWGNDECRKVTWPLALRVGRA